MEGSSVQSDRPVLDPGEIVCSPDGTFAFRIVEHIGEGRCCLVYSAKSIRDTTKVALKASHFLFDHAGFFCVCFRKTQGAKLKTFFITQGSKLKVFSKNSMYRRFFKDFSEKTYFVANFCMQNSKVMLKTASFGCKKHFCG